MIIVCTISLSLMLPIACIRFYSRIWLTRSFGWEDVASALATAGTIAYAGVLMASLNVVGRHEQDIPITAYTTKLIKVDSSDSGFLKVC